MKRVDKICIIIISSKWEKGKSKKDNNTCCYFYKKHKEYDVFNLFHTLLKIFDKWQRFLVFFLKIFLKCFLKTLRNRFCNFWFFKTGRINVVEQKVRSLGISIQRKCN